MTNASLPHDLFSVKVLRPFHGLARTEYPPALDVPERNFFSKTQGSYRLLKLANVLRTSTAQVSLIDQERSVAVKPQVAWECQLLISQYPTPPFIMENLKYRK